MQPKHIRGRGLFSIYEIAQNYMYKRALDIILVLDLYVQKMGWSFFWKEGERFVQPLGTSK